MISKKELEERYDQELKNIQAQIKKPNIFIIGKTGVGKSSLINNVFGEDCATVSDFKPETRGVKRYVHNDVVLFDTEGLELDEKNEASFHKEVLGEIEKRKIGPEKDQIHLIWYLVSATSDRITDYELAVYERLKKYNIPIAIVFTKSDTANEENVNKMLQRFYPKLIFAKSFNDYDTPPFYISNEEKNDASLSAIHLIKWSIKQLPESLKFAFVSSQKVDLEEKMKRAKTAINQHSSANALVGFSPIPFSDAPILIASQMGMIIRIAKIYNLDSLNVKSFMANTGTSLIVSNLGKSVVASLLKFIPVVGTVVGGLINASVAGIITYAMGTSLNTIFYKISNKALLGDKKGTQEILENFEEVFKQEFNTEFRKQKDGK